MRSILDHDLVTGRYFFPRRDAPARTVEVAVDGAVLACAAHAPHEGAPWIVHFHGNGEVVADYELDIAPKLTAAGLNVFFAEYRGYGGSTGAPALVGMLDDVPVILSKVGVPLDRIVVYGRSVGSIYAIEAAHRASSLRGLVIESGIANPLERVLLRVSPKELGVGEAELEREAELHLDHEKKLSSFPGRTLVLHASNDQLIDRTHAERNARWAKRSELVLFDRGDHNTVLDFNLDEIVKRVAQFASAT
jgi:pimeloyl-ACP methyl ester carboxylesterase